MTKSSLRFGLALCFALALPASLTATSYQPAEDSEFGVLVDGVGAETTYYTCSACHSERIVAQQGLSRSGWADMLDWMIEEQGMFEIEEPERTEILDDLETNYNVDRPNFPQPANE